MQPPLKVPALKVPGTFFSKGARLTSRRTRHFLRKRYQVPSEQKRYLVPWLPWLCILAGCASLEGDPVFFYQPQPSFHRIPQCAYVGEFRDARPPHERLYKARTEDLAAAVRKGVHRDLALSGAFRDVTLDETLAGCDLALEGVIHHLYWEGKVDWSGGLPFLRFSLSARAGSGRARGVVDLDVTVRSRGRPERSKTYHLAKERSGTFSADVFAQDPTVGFEATRAFQDAMAELRERLRRDADFFATR